MWIVVRWLVIAAALVIAVAIVPGVNVTGNGWIAVLVMAALLGVINAFIRPFLAFLSCGCIVITLGLFILVINAFTLWAAAYITENWFNLGFSVDGFWPAFWAALIVSVVSFVLNLVLPDSWTKDQLPSGE
jgi:putative membrane protein